MSVKQLGIFYFIFPTNLAVNDPNILASPYKGFVIFGTPRQSILYMLKILFSAVSQTESIWDFGGHWAISVFILELGNHINNFADNLRHHPATNARRGGPTEYNKLKARLGGQIYPADDSCYSPEKK